MDNAAFRTLASSTASKDGSVSNTSKRPMALGSRNRSSIPMTPRNVPGYEANREFARQVAGYTSSANGPPLKKFKSSTAPKGTKLGAGYTDRTQLRRAEDETADDIADKAARLKNLEEQFKLGQIDQKRFETLRDHLGVGGDVQSTHLVKGLDWKLLKRVRNGEDINTSAAGEADKDSDGGEIDVDDELDRVLEQVQFPAKTKTKEASSTEMEGEEQQQEVLSRDDILRRFRQQRDKPAQSIAPNLGGKFKKVAAPNQPGKKKIIEVVNGRKREVLIITKKDGTTKRKTRWIDAEDKSKPEQHPLGMEVPAQLAAKHKAMLEAEAAEDENEDIFADAGHDYDPLAGIESSGDEEEVGEREGQGKDKHDQGENQNETPVKQVKKRNYFGNDTIGGGDATEAAKPINQDPTFLAAIERAARIQQRRDKDQGEGENTGGRSTVQYESDKDAKSSALLAKLRARDRQDDADIDYGFGESRFDDEEDNNDLLDFYDGEGDEGKKGKRKRGPKKRKGDKDNVQDVMSVLEGRKTKK